MHDIDLNSFKERELDILHLMAQGRSNKEIAQQLFITKETVRWYNKQIYSKLGTSRRVEAIEKARQHGLITAEQHATPPRRLHNLPSNLTPLFGRSQELSQINQLIAQRRYRLITLTGIGGTGKTRLALAVAREQLANFADGVWFVSLAEADHTDDILPAIADALQLQLSNDKSVEQQLHAFLARRKLLLILDNLEQLPRDTADIFLTLLDQAEQIVLLTTSRSRLHVRVEKLIPIEGLDVPATSTAEKLSDYSSVALFLERAERLTIAPILESEHPTVAEICRMVTGLPLAIELAAAMTELFDVAEIAATLQTDISALESTMVDVPPRQRSLRAVFEYSWRLLTPAQQQGLAQLSLFRQPFDLDSAETVAQINRHDLSTLRRSSWLQVTTDNRYRIHELLRQFGQERLEANEKWLQETSKRFILFHLHFLRDQLPELERDLTGATLASFRQRRIDCIQAWWMGVAEGRYEPLSACAQPLSIMLRESGLRAEGLALIVETIAAIEAIAHKKDLLSRQRLLAYLYWMQTESILLTDSSNEMLTLLQTARRYALQVEETKLLIHIDLGILRTLVFLHNYDEADPLLTTLTPLVRQHGTHFQRVRFGILHGSLTRSRDQLAKCERIYQETLALIDVDAMPLAAARFQTEVAFFSIDSGQTERAVSLLMSAHDIYERADMQNSKAMVQDGLGYALLLVGRYEKAERHLDESIRYFEAAHHISMGCSPRWKLGYLASRRGEWERAETHWRIVVANQKPLSPFDDLFSNSHLADILCRKGDVAAGAVLLTPFLPTALAQSESEGLYSMTAVALYHALRLMEHDSAEIILHNAVRALLLKAEQFTDPTMRHRFLHNAPGHGDLLKAAEMAGLSVR